MPLCGRWQLLSDLDPVEPIVRYEHEAPGDLLHIDTKKLGRIVRPSHRVTGDRRDSVDGAGWEMLFIAIDDHARVAFTAMRFPTNPPARQGAKLPVQIPGLKVSIAAIAEA